MMQCKTVVFELAVAVLLTGLGGYLQMHGMPGGALALTGVLLAIICVLSRTVSGRYGADPGAQHNMLKSG